MERKETSRVRKLAVAAGLVALAFVVARIVLPARVTTIRQGRELTLRQDLFVMRAALHQYTVDKQQRPQSLDDLVRAGYFREVPTDPTTGRSDTWVVEWSRDPNTPGVRDIHSGSPTYQNW